MTFQKFLTLTAWLTWIIMRSSASSWKNLRRPWLYVCLPQTLMHVILSGIAPPKYTGFSVWHNQGMNTFWSSILLLQEPQNLSRSTKRFCLMLLIFVSVIGNFLPRLFFSCPLMPVYTYTSNTISILSALLERFLQMDHKYFDKSS